jgi:hypothetical protein
VADGIPANEAMRDGSVRLLTRQVTCSVCKRRGNCYGTIGKQQFETQFCMKVWIAAHPEKDDDWGPE